MKEIPITLYHRFLRSRLSDSHPNVFSSIIGRNILRFLERLYTETQYLPPEVLRVAQEELLRTRLAMFSARNQFYRALLAEYGIRSGGIRDLGDLRLLPVIAKADFRKRSLAGLGTDGTGPARRRFGVTSGSTGEPFQFAADRRYALPARANFFRVWRWAGANPHSPVISSAGPGMAGATPNTIFFHPPQMRAKQHEVIERIRAPRARAVR